MRCLALWLALLSLGASGPARAENLWDGQWNLIPAEGRQAAHSFTLEKLSNGMWRYDSGLVLYVLDPSGRAFPEPLSPDYTTVTRHLSAQSLTFEEWLGGVLEEIITRTLSADGKRLDGTVTYVDPSGRQTSHALSAIRVGTGDGLEGRWSELPATSPPSSQQLYWAISSDAAGSMTWTTPKTGEVLKGPADGRQHPLTGPGQPPGKTFTFVKLSPRHLNFQRLRTRSTDRAGGRVSIHGRQSLDRMDLDSDVPRREGFENFRAPVTIMRMGSMAVFKTFG